MTEATLPLAAPAVAAGAGGTVGWLDAVRIEFGVLGALRRRFLAVVSAVVVLGTAYSAVAAYLSRGAAETARWMAVYHRPRPDLLGGTLLVSVLFALIWAAEVWRDAPADDRDWFWAQPIDQGGHELARLVAGALWLLALSIGFAAVAAAAGALAGISGWAAVVTPAAWVDYFTGPLIAYLLGSIAGLRSAHPLRWTLGVPIAIAALPEMFKPAFQPLEVLTSSKIAVFWAVIGPFNGPEHVSFVPPGASWQPYWFAAAAGWLAIAVVGVILVASLRRPA